MKAVMSQHMVCMVETTMLTGAYAVLLYLGVQGVLRLV